MVKCGIDRIGEFGALFRGKRLGMVTSVSGVTLDLRPGYVKFHEVYPLVCLFGPEHGMYGKDGAGEDVDDVARDSATGLPVYTCTAARRAGISRRNVWKRWTRWSMTFRIWARAFTPSSPRCSTSWRTAPRRAGS